MKEQIKKLNKEAGRIKAMIMAKVSSLPDNPKINRISPNCFTIKSSDLGDNWTPTHHDFKKQYSLIYDKLKTKSLDKIIPYITDLAKTGKLKISEGYTQNLHDEVRKYLKELIA